MTTPREMMSSTPEYEAEGPTDPLIGVRLDERYIVEALIGEGGLGRVYRGRHLKLHRPVAIKILLEEHRDMAVLRQRFEREARTLSALSHPNIVTITDFGVDGVGQHEVPYLVMELVEGRDLESVLQSEGRLPPRRAFEIMRQLLKSLAYAHAQGIVHRDLKPGNMLLRSLPDGSEHLEVLDFGLAKFFEEEESPSTTSAKLTRVGTIVGTPAYMAPEQVEGARCDARTDVYAATLVLFEMLTGRMAFESQETATLLRHHLITPPPGLRQSAPGSYAAPELETLMSRGLAKKPSDRFADGAAMLTALEALDFDDAFRPGGGRPSVLAMATLATESGKAPADALRLKAMLDKVPKRLRAPTAQLLEAVRTSPGLAKARGVGMRWRQLPLGVRAAASLAGVLVLTVILSVAVAMLKDDNRQTPGTVTRSLPLGDEEQTVPVIENKPDSRNPWENQAIPAELAPLHARLRGGRRLSRREIGTLNAFASAHPDDPRPLLLRAHAYTAQGWLSGALPYYRDAYAMDPSVRGDPLMLDAIVRMARSRKLASEGATLVRVIYGDEAEEAIEEHIEQANRADDRARLRALLKQL